MCTANIVLHKDNSTDEDKEASGKQEDVSQGTESQAVDSTTKKRSSATGSSSLTSYIEFFKMADEIGLLGPFSTLLQRIKSELTSSSQRLAPSHILAAVQLPRSHSVRSLIAQSCVTAYIRALKNKDATQFRFWKVLGEAEAFAADLFFQYHNVAEQANFEIDRQHIYYQFKDPLTKDVIRLQCSS